MSRRHKGGHGGGGGHAPLWMVSWADMATLLMCFFVLMVAFADFSKEKMHQPISSIQVALTRPWPFPAGGFVPPIIQAGYGRPGKGGEKLKEEEAKVQDRIRRAGLEHQLSARAEPDGLALVTLSSVLFPEGRAELKPEAYGPLGKIAEIVNEYQNKVRVEGHTSSATPEASSPYPTNWELSGARASAVLRYLVERHQIDPKRMSYSGHGSQHPRAEETSPAGRALNDRIEIKLLMVEQGSEEEGILRIRHEEIPGDTEVGPSGK